MLFIDLQVFQFTVAKFWTQRETGRRKRSI